ncbi:MAG: hypothetical protein ACLFPS_09515 [Clostridia bacterium]
MKKYTQIIKLSATKAFDGGILYILGRYLLQLVSLIFLILIWESLANQGADLGIFTLNELIIYSIGAAVLSEQLNIVTPATTSFWEGSIISRYLRPMSVLLHLSLETIGSWLPKLSLFSVPIILATNLFSINLSASIMQSPLAFLASLILSISLGFAIDYIFAALVIRLKNANYTAYSIRMALITFLSGAVIPYNLFPFNLGNILQLLPFGSLASAPLLILLNKGNIDQLIFLQVFWNIFMWPLAIYTFSKSKERMVSYGGNNSCT